MPQPDANPYRPQRKLLAAILPVLVWVSPVTAQSAPERLPYRLLPVDYFGATDEPVARLIEQLSSGAKHLDAAPGSGYLPALLAALEVPASSQLLVFAKNAANARLISPENPRAIYFRDDVSIGWTPGAPAIEIATVDPRKGAVFYTLRQDPAEPPRFRRDDSCLTCHVTDGTLQVPGFILRSFVTDAAGRPRNGYSPVTHATPYEKRWGGWYVTGATAEFQHMGNLSTARSISLFETRGQRQPTIDLESQLVEQKHLRMTSDVVPLLVHDHQTRVHTLLTRVRYEAEFGRPPASLDLLVNALLFAHEPVLPAPITHAAEYQRWFEQQGPAGSASRRLREFDLQTRLFRRGCSWLIDSPACRSLPADVRSALDHRIEQILSSPHPPPGIRALDDTDRVELLNLLRDGVADFGAAGAGS